MEKETKKQRFKRIAAKRTNVIIDMLRLLGNCANKSNYEYSQDEVDKIFTEIDRELKMNKAKFMNGLSRKKSEFQL